MRGALAGVRVVELAGLAPVPHVGIMMADLGATVVRVDRAGGGSSVVGSDRLGRGKRSVALNLKTKEGAGAFRRLCQWADVLLDPFRPGVLERLGLSPETVLLVDNARLVVLRLSGFGQTGPWAARSGHDINYLATAGALRAYADGPGGPPVPPANLVADFGGGSILGLVGVLSALLERGRTGRGCVLDHSITEGVGYLMAFVWASRGKGGLWGGPAGANLLDGGAPFYRCYRCADDGYMAVGALEPQFYQRMLHGLGYKTEAERDALPNRYDPSEWPALRDELSARFSSRTRDEWARTFSSIDACVTPVLELDEVEGHEQHAARGSFRDGMPVPVPMVAGTEPTGRHRRAPHVVRAGEHSRAVLRECAGLSEDEVSSMVHSGAASEVKESKL